MILLIRLMIYLGIILVFMVLPPLVFGFRLARNLSWWTKHDKVKGHVTVKSPKLSRLLVKRCHGYFTNTPKWSWRYWVNEHPNQISYLGVIDHVVVVLVSLFWVYHMVGYFFLLDFANPNISLAIILLMGHAVVAFILIVWNQKARRIPETTMSRKEWKAYQKRL